MYTPNNTDVYLRASAGFMAGITFPIVNDVVQSDYSLYGEMADAFAQQLDTLWGAPAPTVYEQFLIEQASEAVWENRSPPPTVVATTPSSYITTANAVIARVKQSNAQVVSQGIDPNGSGSPGTGTVTNVTASSPIVITGTSTIAPNVTITAATDLAPGSMSAADKTKLDSLATGAISFVANAAALTALAVTGFPIGALAFCGVPGAATPSFCAYFTLQSATGLSVDGVTVVASSSGALVWTRTVTGIAALAAGQTAWFVDRVGGNDENSGLTLGAAVQHKAEIARRMGGWSPIIAVIMTMTYVSADTDDTDPGLWTPNFQNGGTLTHTAPLPAAAFTGTLLAVTAKSSAGNTALQSTFTTTTGAVAARMLLVNTTRANSRAIAQKIISGGNWQISQPFAPYAANTLPTNTENNAWANGDAIQGFVPLAVCLPVIGGKCSGLISPFAPSHVVSQVSPFLANGLGPIQADLGAYFFFVDCPFVSTAALSVVGAALNAITSSATNCFIPFLEAFNAAAGLTVNGGVVAGGRVRSAGLNADVILTGTNFTVEDTANFGIGPAFVDTGLTLRGIGAMGIATGTLYGPGTYNQASGVMAYTNTAVATFPLSGGLQLNGVATGYSNLTTAGLTAVHQLALSATNLDAAAGAAGFGGYAYGGGATFSKAGAQP